MAARMAFIAALVLAFAQPILPAKDTSKFANKPVVNSLYLDNSLSMENTTENQRYLDLAVIKIDELLTLFKQSPTIQLITNDFVADDQVVTNATRIKDRLTMLRFSANARSLSDINNRQKKLIEKHDPNAASNRFWFSDFQKSTTGNLKAISLDSTDKLFIVPVQGEATQNVYVDSVWLASPFIREMQNNIVYAKLRNAGSKSVEKLPIQLYIDDAQSSTASVSIGADGFAIATFNFTVRDRGVHRGKIAFDDQPITFDNEYYFVINASPSVRVTHVYQERSGEDYIGKLFSNDSLFTYRSYNALNVGSSLLTSTDLLVIEGVERFDGSLKSSVESFVRAGGSVFMIPSSKLDETSYKTFLGDMGIRNVQKNASPAAAQNQLPIAEPDKNNPFYSDVFEQTTLKTTIDVPTMQPVLSWSGSGQPLLSFRNQRPFLTQVQEQMGTFYLAASPLDVSYGNFAQHAFYVPTLIKMAARSVKPEPAAYNFSQRVIQLHLPNSPKNATYKLKNKDMEIIPIQRVQNATLLMELPKNSELSDNQQLVSGYYDLTIDGKAIKTLAINHDNEESQMSYYTPDELRSAFANNPNVQVFDGILDGDFIESFADNNLGKSLWKYFIYAALAFLLIEILLVRFMKG